MNHVSKNITFDSDGVYRWAYELNLYKNPTILFLIWKIFGGILLALWLFMVVLEVIDDNLSLDNLFELTVGLLLFSLGFGLICLLGYLLYALIMGGKYCVLFEMDDNAMAGRPGVVGTGMLAGARTSMYTSFADVRSVESCPGRNLIKVNELLNKNQVYAEDEDFDFVLNFIRAHTKS